MLRYLVFSCSSIFRIYVGLYCISLETKRTETVKYRNFNISILFHNINHFFYFITNVVLGECQVKFVYKFVNKTLKTVVRQYDPLQNIQHSTDKPQTPKPLIV